MNTPEEKIAARDEEIRNHIIDKERLKNVIAELSAALMPFADAAERADEESRKQSRLLGSTMGPNASPGWGIKRHHLDTARRLVG